MQYTERFNLALTPQERSVLKILAADDAGSKASVVRRLVRREAKRRGLWPQPAAGEHVREGEGRQHE